MMWFTVLAGHVALKDDDMAAGLSGCENEHGAQSVTKIVRLRSRSVEAISKKHHRKIDAAAAHLVTKAVLITHGPCNAIANICAADQ